MPTGAEGSSLVVTGPALGPREGTPGTAVGQSRPRQAAAEGSLVWNPPALDWPPPLTGGQVRCLVQIQPRSGPGQQALPAPRGGRKPPEAPRSPLAWLTSRPKQQPPPEQTSTGGWCIFKRSYLFLLTVFLFHNSHTVVGHPRHLWPTHRASHGEVTSESESGGCWRWAEQSKAVVLLGEGRKASNVSGPAGKL